MWSTPWARATSSVPSVEPSSTTSHSTASKPGSSRGRSRSVAGSVRSSLKQGIWMISFIAPTETVPRASAAADVVLVGEGDGGERVPALLAGAATGQSQPVDLDQGPRALVGQRVVVVGPVEVERRQAGAGL